MIRLSFPCLPTKRLFYITALLSIYILTYAVNSVLGGYWPYLQPSRKFFYRDIGLSFRTRLIWQPRWGYSSDLRRDAIGWLYFPLIKIDQEFIHSDIDIFEVDDLEEKYRSLRFHPAAKEK